jgi:hypothetical protein
MIKWQFVFWNTNGNAEDNYCTVLHSSSLARDYPSVQGDTEGRCQDFLNLEAARIPIEVTDIIFYLENKQIPATMALNCPYPWLSTWLKTPFA